MFGKRSEVIMSLIPHRALHLRRWFEVNAACLLIVLIINLGDRTNWKVLEHYIFVGTEHLVH